MNNPLNKIITLIFIGLMHFAPQVLQAQSPIPCAGPGYYIWNHRNCPITVLYEVSDCNGNVSGCTNGVGIVCFDSICVIPPSTQFWLPCCRINPNTSLYPPPCTLPTGDVFVWLRRINFINVNGNSTAQAVGGGNCFTNQAIGAGPVPMSITPPCNAPPNYLVLWSPTGTDIY